MAKVDKTEELAVLVMISQRTKLRVVRKRAELNAQPFHSLQLAGNCNAHPQFRYVHEYFIFMSLVECHRGG